jgi:hypothetical protein
MSATNGKPPGRPPHRHSKAEPARPGDEQFTYTRKQLIRMDNRFRARLMRAFKRGKESRESAAQAYVIPSRSLAELLTAPAPL